MEQPLIADAVSRDETIVGRIGDARVVRLLTSANRLIELDLQGRRARSTRISNLEDNDKVSGLGRTADGGLWTLTTPATLARVQADGALIERRQLARRVGGLHAPFEELVYQALDLTGGSPVLIRSVADDSNVIPWGTLTVAAGDEAGPIRLAQSLATCGMAAFGRAPCWLSNASAVELIDRGGHAERIDIPALRRWTTADAGAFARNPHRVIRDVWLESASTMWILVRVSASDVPDRGGERGLWRINSRGEVLGRHVLPRRARMILGGAPGRLVVLTADGHVVSEEV
jgi:hypothetical protein